LLVALSWIHAVDLAVAWGLLIPTPQQAAAVLPVTSSHVHSYVYCRHHRLIAKLYLLVTCGLKYQLQYLLQLYCSKVVVVVP
jgi:hypothetical protein